MRYSLACIQSRLHLAVDMEAAVSSLSVWCHIGCVQPPAKLECGGAAEVLCHQVQ